MQNTGNGPRLEALETKLLPHYKALAAHPLYRSLASIADLRTFMEAHVFAVWDFMSLLKALQRGLTCVDVPWLPSPMPESRRLVNEIVLGEESDEYGGRPLSHFEIYLEAMECCGASTAAVKRLVDQLAHGAALKAALQSSDVPEEAANFVRGTFQIISRNKLHVIAAAFTFGREDLIPDMFKGFVRDLDRELAGQLRIFVWYLERHIEVDGDQHGPMALRMIAELCGDDPMKWSEAEEAALFALQSRLRLWDGILDKVRSAKSTTLQ